MPGGELSASFLSADTADLWTSDLVTFEERLAHTVRGAIGERCVVYTEGDRIARVPQSWLDYFDSEVYTLESSLFREPPDRDGNGKVVFAVVTGDGFAGYFNPADGMSDEEARRLWGTHSNEMELLYINADIVGYGGGYWRSVVPHEYQHLLYAEEHPDIWDDWSYHNEGLAECAVRAVNGENDYAVSAYFDDRSGIIAGGLSMVHWSYDQYENYALAYLFWSYVAAQLDGVSTFSDVFHLPSGSPDVVDEYLRGRLGAFNDVQRDSLIALWLKEASGTYGYGDMIDLSAEGPPPRIAGPGAGPRMLEPFAGTFVTCATSPLDYSATTGLDIVYVGLNGAGAVDLEAPFDVEGGAALVYNSRFEFRSFVGQPTGLPYPSREEPLGFAPAASPRRFSAAWADPPPLPPVPGAPFTQWRSMLTRIGLLRPSTGVPGLPDGPPVR
ncbi:MAG: hypothetical protein HY905_22130 [Deltaproteobacteria bacterium]|nr:hypothetical protein [Deltaproteobacteria bacterium]